MIADEEPTEQEPKPDTLGPGYWTTVHQPDLTTCPHPTDAISDAPPWVCAKCTNRVTYTSGDRA